MKKTFQIIFNKTSAAELSALPKLLQLEMLSDFENLPEELFTPKGKVPESFGRMEREGRSLYRFRAGDYRLYFERAPEERAIVIHRVLHKNTLADFLFRSSLPGTEDETLQKNPAFWKMIEEGKSSPPPSSS